MSHRFGCPPPLSTNVEFHRTWSLLRAVTFGVRAPLCAARCQGWDASTSSTRAGQSESRVRHVSDEKKDSRGKGRAEPRLRGFGGTNGEAAVPGQPPEQGRDPKGAHHAKAGALPRLKGFEGSRGPAAVPSAPAPLETGVSTRQQSTAGHETRSTQGAGATGLDQRPDSPFDQGPHRSSPGGADTSTTPSSALKAASGSSSGKFAASGKGQFSSGERRRLKEEMATRSGRTRSSERTESGARARGAADPPKSE